MKKCVSAILLTALLASSMLTGCLDNFNMIVKNNEGVSTTESVSSQANDDGEVEFTYQQPETKPEEPQIDEPSTCTLSQQEIDAIVNNTELVLAQYPDFSGTVLLSAGNRIIYEESVGSTNGRGGENSNDTIYQIGSVTKQFTGTAIFMLEKEGKLNVNDTLDKYFPEYDAEFLKQVTISQLLQMTAGLGDYMTTIEGTQEILDNYLKAASKGEAEAKKFIVDIIMNDGLVTDPGKVYTYSNSAYYLLGVIIEQLSGMSYRDYLQTYFFDYANMTNTFFVGEGKDNQTGYSGAMLKYVSDNDDKYLKAEGDYPYLFSAGSVVSTVEDVDKWMRVVASDDIFTLADRKKVENALWCYNYGWNTSDNLWHHSGRTYCYSSQVYSDYKTDTHLVILTNVAFYENLNELSYKIYLPLVNAVKKR
ncbi:MAG: serine hydrolase domain-containing protein [Acutalibacteraceae bacterium]|nr:serine hydrolase domain-containing protein [Acutalibacteraceae bacterium]